METTWRRACLGAALVLVGLTLWRWHEVDAVRPARIEGVEGPTAILLLQPGDCPDRRAAVLRWLEGRPGREGTEPLRPPSVLDAPFARLPRLGAGEIPEAERALLRAGVEGTPALLLVDAEGCLLAHMNGPAEWASEDARRLVSSVLPDRQG